MLMKKTQGQVLTTKQEEKHQHSKNGSSAKCSLLLRTIGILKTSVRDVKKLDPLGTDDIKVLGYQKKCYHLLLGT
jgi:hypothetical protein